jgi:hypothetical protein
MTPADLDDGLLSDPQFSGLLPFHEHSFTTKEGSDAFKNAVHVKWTLPMIALFIQKLPRNLETFNCPIVDHSLLAFLPPHLSCFQMTEMTQFRAVIRNDSEFVSSLPESLNESLETLRIGFTPKLNACPFHNLHTLLGYDATQMGSADLLPTTLTSLSVYGQVKWRHTILIPRSLVSLRFVGLWFPLETSHDDDDDDDEEDAQDFPSNFNFDLLPPRLTELDIDLELVASLMMAPMQTWVLLYLGCETP